MSNSASPYVIDVDEATFQRDVIERSRTVPVVVDFWAPWCGPCRVLSPVLTNLAQEYNGRFVLAKINVDENQRLAARYGVQGIPLVKAFREGRVVDEFVGAQPHPTVRQFIERLAPDPLDVRVAAGQALLTTEQYVEAEGIFREVLGQDAQRTGALLGLAAALLGQNRDAEAEATLASIPPDSPAAADADRLRRELEQRAALAGVNEDALRAQVAATPDDLETRFQLANVLAVTKRYEEALDHYLEIVRRNKRFGDGAARQAMLDLFGQLGDENPLVRTYRNKLAMVLFV